MKFLLDENVPNNLKMELIKNGFNDIKRINDFGKGLSDEEVFSISLKEGRVIITIDKDFFAYKKTKNNGIISLSGKLNDPVSKMISVMEQLNIDQRFQTKNYKNVFIRITNLNFKVIYKKKNKYKENLYKYKQVRYKKTPEEGK